MRLRDWVCNYATLNLPFARKPSNYACCCCTSPWRSSVPAACSWQQTEAYNEFPEFSTSYQNLIQSRWELQSFNPEIYDYGRAVWKGRSMETSFVKVAIRVRNRILGEYRDVCFVFARMKDTEFSMIRDTLEVNCGQPGKISDWQKAHSFESLWHVEMAGS
jgi:hypothetical protein